jgi:hypothetical protein
VILLLGAVKAGYNVRLGSLFRILYLFLG